VSNKACKRSNFKLQEREGHKVRLGRDSRQWTHGGSWSIQEELWEFQPSTRHPGRLTRLTSDYVGVKMTSEDAWNTSLTSAVTGNAYW